MSVGSFLSVKSVNERAYDFEESYKLRVQTRRNENKEEAMQKVEEAKHANTQTTMKMMDRHNEMVEKSQKLREQKAKKDAIERLNRERQEEHTELLKEMSLRDAERSDLLEAARLKGLS